MALATSRENELIGRLVRRIDRKVEFHATHREDGDIELRLQLGKLKTLTQLSPAALEASGGDVVQFEALRGKIKRVLDRVKIPAPPPKVPKVEIQKDVAFGPRPGGPGGRGGRGGRR